MKELVRYARVNIHTSAFDLHDVKKPSNLLEISFRFLEILSCDRLSKKIKIFYQSLQISKIKHMFIYSECIFVSLDLNMYSSNRYDKQYRECDNYYCNWK